MPSFRKSLPVILCLGTLSCSFFAHGQTSNPPPPKEVASCVECHGVSGRSQADVVPGLAALQGNYIETELKAYRDKSRHNEAASGFMWEMAKNLTDTEITVISNYYSTQTPPHGHRGDPVLLSEGKDYFLNGNPKTKVMGCAMCHGQEAEGNEMAPRLAGQQSHYLMTQYYAFKENSRKEATTMPTMIAALDLDEMAAIAYYLESLGEVSAQYPQDPFPIPNPIDPASNTFTEQRIFNLKNIGKWTSYCNASSKDPQILELRHEAARAAVRSCRAHGYQCYNVDVAFSYAPGDFDQIAGFKIYKSCFVNASVSGGKINQ